MSVHFLKQIDRLRRDLIELATMVEEAVRDALLAVETRNVDMAERIVAGDAEIDLKEIDVEEECLHTLALYQPVAMDLRYIVAVLKLNHDLERIGDLAVNIARQTAPLAGDNAIDIDQFDLPAMTGHVQRMLKQTLGALVESDPDLAEQARGSDDTVDDLHRAMFDKVEHAIDRDPKSAGQYIRVLSISRALERMADHAANICKDVVYMTRGEIVRHRRQQQLRAKAKEVADRAAQQDGQ